MNFLKEYGIYLLAFGVMGLIALCRWLAFRPKGSRQELTGHATVLSRRTEYAKAARERYSNNWNYRVTFQVGNQVLDLYVTQSQFPQLTEGLTGQLTWQREYLVDFVPDEA